MRVIYRKIISVLLHYANTSPPMMQKGQFYSIKSKLLERHGTLVGYDVQHIPGKICWDCDGINSDGCYRCSGTGFYRDEKWVGLNRYEFGAYTFHIPADVSYKKPEPDTTRIRGYVQHAYHGRLSDEAFAWLCLLTGHTRLLWKWLIASRACGWQLLPMIVLQQVVTTIIWRARDVRAKCKYCGRHVFKSNILICSRCSDVRRKEWAEMDDLPF